MLTVLAVLSILVFVGLESLPFWRISESWTTLGGVEWFPRENLYGFLPSVIGTLSVVVFALLVSVPLSTLTALAAAFFWGERPKTFFQIWLETAAGFPAVVVGLFGLLTLLPWLNTLSTPATGLLAAALVLSLILVPGMTVGMMDVFSAETRETLKVGQSLGISKTTLLFRVIGPEKFQAWVRTVALAASRGLGETLAIMMVAGNVVQIPDGIFSSFRTINATIALEMPYAQGAHRSSLFAAGLTIFVLVIGIRSLVWLTSKYNSGLQR